MGFGGSQALGGSGGGLCAPMPMSPRFWGCFSGPWGVLGILGDAGALWGCREFLWGLVDLMEGGLFLGGSMGSTPRPASPGDPGVSLGSLGGLGDPRGLQELCGVAEGSYGVWWISFNGVSLGFWRWRCSKADVSQFLGHPGGSQRGLWEPLEVGERSCWILPPSPPTCTPPSHP